jgi:hypothetical protein
MKHQGIGQKERSIKKQDRRNETTGNRAQKERSIKKQDRRNETTRIRTEGKKNQGIGQNE